MKENRRQFLRGAALGAATLPLSGWVSQPSVFTFEELADSLMASWQRSSAYMLEVAHAMPAEEYDFRPTSEIRSFAEQMLHVASSVDGFATMIERNPYPDQSPYDVEGKSKDEVITLLEQALAHATTALEALTETQATETMPWGGRLYAIPMEMPLFGVARVLHDHTTHHRGQAIIYLRMKGIAPPTYVD